MYAMYAALLYAALLYAALLCTTLLHAALLHYCMLHYCMLHYCMLHYCMLHYCMLHYCMLHYCMLHYCMLHYCMLHYICCIWYSKHVFKMSKTCFQNVLFEEDLTDLGIDLIFSLILDFSSLIVLGLPATLYFSHSPQRKKSGGLK